MGVRMWGPRSPAKTHGANISDEGVKQILALGDELREAVQRLVSFQKINDPPLLWFSQLYVVIDHQNIHYVFNTKASGGMATEIVQELPGTISYSRQAVIEFASTKGNIVAPDCASISKLTLSLPQQQRAMNIHATATTYLASLGRIEAPKGYEHLQPLLDQFRIDHPDYEKSVFLMMRFRSEPYFVKIQDSIVTNLEHHGLKCIRADAKTYPSDGDLWNNVCVHMLGCKYGVSVYEDIDEREFGANISLEYGFMRAFDKKVLLLRERRLPTMPADIIGKLYRTFDQHDIEPSIAKVIDEWITRDLHLK